MKTTFKTIIRLRESARDILDNHTLQEINKIPKSFSNNLLWNTGHMLVTQQRLTYGLSNNVILVSDELLTLFSKGTKPEQVYSEDLYQKVKKLLVCTAKDLEQDYNSGIFKTFNPYKLGIGVEINSIEEAIHFVSVHEGIHYGYMLALQKALTKKGLF